MRRYNIKFSTQSNLQQRIKEIETQIQRNPTYIARNEEEQKNVAAILDQKPATELGHVVGTRRQYASTAISFLGILVAIGFGVAIATTPSENATRNLGISSAAVSGVIAILAMLIGISIAKSINKEVGETKAYETQNKLLDRLPAITAEILLKEQTINFILNFFRQNAVSNEEPSPELDRRGSLSIPSISVPASPPLQRRIRGESNGEIKEGDERSINKTLRNNLIASLEKYNDLTEFETIQNNVKELHPKVEESLLLILKLKLMQDYNQFYIDHRDRIQVLNSINNFAQLISYIQAEPEVKEFKTIDEQQPAYDKIIALMLYWLKNANALTALHQLITLFARYGQDNWDHISQQIALDNKPLLQQMIDYIEEKIDIQSADLLTLSKMNPQEIYASLQRRYGAVDENPNLTPLFAEALRITQRQQTAEHFNQPADQALSQHRFLAPLRMHPGVQADNNLGDSLLPTRQSHT